MCKFHNITNKYQAFVPLGVYYIRIFIWPLFNVSYRDSQSVQLIISKGMNRHFANVDIFYGKFLMHGGLSVPVNFNMGKELITNNYNH